MKYNSLRRSCLFNAPQWFWYETSRPIDYPSIANVVSVSNRAGGAFKVYIAVPIELYAVMKQQGIKEVIGFILTGRQFSMLTDKGTIPLWVFTSSLPRWVTNPEFSF